MKNRAALGSLVLIGFHTKSLFLFFSLDFFSLLLEGMAWGQSRKHSNGLPFCREDEGCRHGGHDRAHTTVRLDVLEHTKMIPP